MAAQPLVALLVQKLMFKKKTVTYKHIIIINYSINSWTSQATKGRAIINCFACGTAFS